MKKLYTLSKQLIAAVTICLTLFGTPVFAQTTCSLPIAEDFDDELAGTAGFTGSFSYGTQGGGPNFDGFLRRTNIIPGGVYTVTTPTYTLPASATVIGYGFQLDGSEKVARIAVKMQYRSNATGQVETVILADIVPNYGTGTTANVCRSIELSERPDFAGGEYRFIFEFTSNTGSGAPAATIIFDDFRTSGTLAQIPLPVTFMGISAKKVSVGVEVTWKIAGEYNVNRYELERSTDGRNFNTIATVATTKRDTYTYLDATAGGTVYYRVKNVDNDGKYKYSSIARLINGRSEIVLKAFPQPVDNQLTVQHPAIEGNTVINITTADGRVIKSVKPSAGSIQTYIDMTLLQKGMYMLRFDTGDGKAETLKVLKQ